MLQSFLRASVRHHLGVISSWFLDIVVAPPALYVDSVRSSLRPEVAVAGQNAYEKANGAFTGENRQVSRCSILLIYSYFIVRKC